jgi:hypothetical protein
MRTPDGKNTVHEPPEDWMKQHLESNFKTMANTTWRYDYEKNTVTNEPYTLRLHDNSVKTSYGPADYQFEHPPVDKVKASQTATTGGRKFDGGKLQYGLVPPNALKATVEILTFGAEKYEPDNWKWVPDSKRRYFDAAQRHLWAWKSGEQNDQETGKNHLAHALCCLMFLYEHDTINFLDNGEVNEAVK